MEGSGEGAAGGLREVITGSNKDFTGEDTEKHGGSGRSERKRAKPLPRRKSVLARLPSVDPNCYFPLLYCVMVNDQSSRKNFTPDALTAAATVMLWVPGPSRMLRFIAWLSK